jgi:hypothetical protein
MQVDWRLCLGASLLLLLLTIALFHSAARVERSLKLIYAAVRPEAPKAPAANKKALKSDKAFDL